MSVRFALRYLERDIWFFSGSLLLGEDGNAMLSATLTASSHWVALEQDWGIFGEQMWCTEPGFSQSVVLKYYQVFIPKNPILTTAPCPVQPSHCAQGRAVAWEGKWKSCALTGILGWTAASRMCCRTQRKPSAFLHCLDLFRTAETPKNWDFIKVKL